MYDDVFEQSVAQLTSRATYLAESKMRRKSCATKSNILAGWENTYVTIQDSIIHVLSFETKHTGSERKCHGTS